MLTRPPWVSSTRHNGRWQIWAPSPVKIGNTYWVYFGANRSGATDLHNDQCKPRLTHWARLEVSTHADPATQTIRLID
jgi:hypothetical protein